MSIKLWPPTSGIPAPRAAPLWIIGPSFPQGKPGRAVCIIIANHRNLVNWRNVPVSKREHLNKSNSFESIWCNIIIAFIFTNQDNGTVKSARKFEKSFDRRIHVTCSILFKIHLIKTNHLIKSGHLMEYIEIIHNAVHNTSSYTKQHSKCFAK